MLRPLSEQQMRKHKSGDVKRLTPGHTGGHSIVMLGPLVSQLGSQPLSCLSLLSSETWNEH